MPVIEEVNDDATDDRQSMPRSGSGDRAQNSGSSTSTSVMSRLIVSVILCIETQFLCSYNSK